MYVCMYVCVCIYVSYIGVVSVVSQYNCVYYCDTCYIHTIAKPIPVLPEYIGVVCSLCVVSQYMVYMVYNCVYYCVY
jgi:hypothetical protein